MCFVIDIRFLILFILSMSYPVCLEASNLEVKFCGFEQKCSVNITEPISKNDLCCRPCECEDTCLEKGTCCRDKVGLSNADADIKQKCLLALYAPNGIHGHTKSLPYYTRTSCPNEYKDMSIKARCENTGHDSITEIRPVSSHDGTIIYKNKYCSLCHGEKKSIGWEVTVHKASPMKCHRILQYETLNIDTISAKILSNCILHFIPPTNIDFWKVICFEDSKLIKNCNITGKWNTFDEQLNDKCLNETDVGYFIFDDSGRVYQNLHCSLCNSRGFDSTGTCLQTLARDPYAPMFSLLNLNKLFDQERSKDKNKPKRCVNDEILDTYFNKCRKLNCFRGLIPVKGKCVPFLYKLTGYKLSIKLKTRQHINYTDLSENDLRKLYTSIQNILGVKDCGLCFIFVYVDKDSMEDNLQDIQVLYAFTPTSRCRVEHILSTFMALETKLPFILNLTLNNDSVLFTAFQDNATDVQRKRWRIFIEEGLTSMCASFSPERRQICPKVELLKQEVENVMAHHPKANELDWTQNVNGSAFVCCDKYISHQTSLSPINFSQCLFVIIKILWFLGKSF